MRFAANRRFCKLHADDGVVTFEELVRGEILDELHGLSCREDPPLPPDDVGMLGSIPRVSRDKPR